MKRLVPIAIALSLTILLASIAVAQGGVSTAHLSDTPDGPAMTSFPQVQPSFMLSSSMPT